MPRWMEILLSFLAVCLLSPVLAGAAVAVVAFDGRPVIFAHRRIGRNGRPFDLYKFRTMRRSTSGPSVTTAGDSRITSIGAFLRKSKIDELPQLVNVLLGDMSFVGPRPEVQEFVDLYTPEQRKVLSVRPGITDPASIVYHDEAAILAQAPDWREAYVMEVLPEKLRLSLSYIERKTCLNDFRMILATVGVIAKTRMLDKR